MRGSIIGSRAGSAYSAGRSTSQERPGAARTGQKRPELSTLRIDSCPTTSPSRDRPCRRPRKSGHELALRPRYPSAGPEQRPRNVAMPHQRNRPDPPARPNLAHTIQPTSPASTTSHGSDRAGRHTADAAGSGQTTDPRSPVLARQLISFVLLGASAVRSAMAAQSQN
jgi:hypothetical protein